MYNLKEVDINDIMLGIELIIIKHIPNIRYEDIAFIEKEIEELLTNK